jgi:cytochrome c-type biogenesis protein
MMSFSIPALFGAGLLTFLSPCVLPLVPIYLATLAGTSAVALRDDGARTRRLLLTSAAFALGITLVFVLLGLAASALGRVLSGHRVLLVQLGGLAVFLVGLKLIGVVHIPWLDREARPWLASVERAGGILWPFLFGAAFALGWSPCVGPLLGSVLLYAASSGSAVQSAAYLAVYALGLTLPLLAVAMAVGPALRLLDRAKRYLRAFEATSGIVLAAMGLLFVTGHQAWLFPTDAADTTLAAAAAPEPAAAPATCSAGVANPGPAAEPPAMSTAPSPLPTMLEFVSAGCPICRRMSTIVAAAEKDCSRHGVHVEQVDVATTAGRARASEYGVLGVPTFLFLDRNGGEVARLVGEQPQQTLIQSLEVLAGEKCDGFRPLPAGTGS